MKYQKWSGKRLKDLLTLDWEDFTKEYPTTKKTNWKALRRYYTNKINGETTMPETGPERQPIKRLVSESEYDAWIKNSDGEIESEPKVARRYEYLYEENQEDSVDQLFPQVEPAKIRPTKRKRAQRLGEMILGYGDGQVDFRLIRDPRTLETEVLPLQNIPMHRIILQMNAYYQPETTVNLGDFADFAGSSRFPADSDHFNGSMTLAMNWIHDFYAQMVNDNPNAKHVEVPSNHGDRPRKKVLAVAPEFYNFYRPGEEYPAWTYYSMANLGALGIKLAGGYPNGEYVHGDPEHPQIIFKHGVKTGKNAIEDEANKNPTVNIVRGHNHAEKKIKRTTRDGKQLFYIILGSACVNGSNVPGYHNSIDDFNQPDSYHNQEHSNSFIMIRDYGEGRYEPVTIDVVDGKAYYDGMEWNGNEPYEWEHRYGYIKEEK